MTAARRRPPARPRRARVRCPLEVLTGARPVRQLAPVSSPGLCAGLETSLAEVSRRMRPLPGTSAACTCSGGEGAAEVCAVVRRGGRVRALALRLERRGGTWQCTAFAEI